MVAKRVTNCATCGKPFPHPPSRAARFCSNACQGRWQSTHLIGANSPFWKGEAAARHARGRGGYRQWRNSVLRRDGYTCQQCGERPAKLVAHHIRAWATDPDLRYSPSNGQTLCVPCHIATHRALRGHL